MIGVNKWTREMKNINDTSLFTIDIDTAHNNSETKPQKIYDLRRAAECHKIARRHIQEIIKPGMKLLDIVNQIEGKIIGTFKKNDLTMGVGFPTGVSLNNIICHDTANHNDTRIFNKNDLIKIDIGCHINGHIIDSAFSISFNNQLEILLNASKDATMTAIKMLRPDVHIYEISKTIKEVIESYDVDINGKNYKLKPIRDLGGHSIDKYNIHSGELILCSPYDSKEYKENKIRENQQYAIETFASTGCGIMKKCINIPSNHYMINKEFTGPYHNKLKTINNVHNWIKKNRSTLPFSPRWLEIENIKGVTLSLNDLARKNQVLIEYPPLEDSMPNSYVSHYEHTVYVYENYTENFTYDEDY